VFCRSLYILLPLAMHCLSFELRFLITPLVSSNFSMKDWWQYMVCRNISCLQSNAFLNKIFLFLCNRIA
jgi:hypothetical protein